MSVVVFILIKIASCIKVLMEVNTMTVVLMQLNFEKTNILVKANCFFRKICSLVFVSIVCVKET